MRQVPVVTLIMLSLLCLGADCGGLPQDLGACPDGSTVTWADAEPAFAANCTRCHSSELQGALRNAAPEEFDYDTAEASRANLLLTWSEIFTGDMPNDADFTSDEHALIIHEWASCGGPD